MVQSNNRFQKIKVDKAIDKSANRPIKNRIVIANKIINKIMTTDKTANADRLANKPIKKLVDKLKNRVTKKNRAIADKIADKIRTIKKITNPNNLNSSTFLLII